jgi:hypothetical protein
MNSTSTTVPLWQLDCESFRRTLRPFVLRDVTNEEHHQFVKDFAKNYELHIRLAESAVTFYPSSYFNELNAAIG